MVQNRQAMRSMGVVDRLDIGGQWRVGTRKQASALSKIIVSWGLLGKDYSALASTVIRGQIRQGAGRERFEKNM